MLAQSCSRTRTMPLADQTDYSELVCELVTRRQQVSPKHLHDPGPAPAEVQQLWTAAAQAPDHALILPWRFVQVTSTARESLGEAFVQALLERDSEATEAQRNDARVKATRAPFLALAIARLGGDAHPEIPSTERLVSLGCALQNMLLMAQAQGFGTALVSGQAMDSAALRSLFGLAANEKAICFVAVGTVSKSRASRVRPSPLDFVTAL